MGNVIGFHARASAQTSDVAGRTTSGGQMAPSGQLSENQRITSSYLRAVKVEPSSSRSKKRPSFATRRPTVERDSERAAANAEAQAMRLDRSSVSMVADHSGSFPTFQANSVGKVQLAHRHGKLDKSTMPTAPEVRATIRQALKERGIGAIKIITQMKRDGLVTVDRTYLRDFLIGKKQSLGPDFIDVLADFLGLEPKQLRVSRGIPLPAIRKGAKPHLYVAEHMEHHGLDDETMASRMDGVSAVAVAKWRADPSKMQEWQVAAVLHALGEEDPAILTKPPAPRRRLQRPPKTIRKRVSSA